MNLDTFLHQLHFDTDQVRPPDWEVDWNDAPLTFKLYQGLPTVPLCREVPLSLAGREINTTPELRSLGHMLWYAYGIAQLSESVIHSDPQQQEPAAIMMKRRFVPSGGGLYPSELYVYLKLKELPAGVYHYDAAHHRLVMLRKGEFDSVLVQALGHRCDVSACFGIIFVSTMFWKNFFKYNNFSYRLQGLDAGVLMGQLLEAAKRFGFSSGVYFQFLDRVVNHLLGLSAQEESVYAILPLSVKPASKWFIRGNTDEKNRKSAENDKAIIRDLPAIQTSYYLRSKQVKPYPLLVAMNEASMFECARSFNLLDEDQEADCKQEGEPVFLPDVQRILYDMADACKRRQSPELDFIMNNPSQYQLASLLYESSTSYAYVNDLDPTDESFCHRVLLYGCFYGVEGIPNGAYYYDAASRSLRLLQPGDHRLRLQIGMPVGNVNLYQVPFCFHIAGDKKHYSSLGYRGYRIQQMEAGMLVQRLLLTAAALGMGGHPLLGFDARISDDLYRLAPLNKTSLIQIPIGTYRPRSRLEWGLHI